MSRNASYKIYFVIDTKSIFPV